MKPILKHPHTILATPATPVTDFTNSETREIIQELKETLVHTQHGIGLAANQIGYTKRIFYVKLENFDKIFINPLITALSDEVKMEEGCLSVPGKIGAIIRAKKVMIKALDESGKKFKMKARGLLAQVLQHETDHLDGHLYIDKALSVANELPSEK